MRQIEVRIMGQSYLLGCAEGAEQELLEAVAKVDREMCTIRDGGKLRARERIAVLAALNLAVMLSQKSNTPDDMALTLPLEPATAPEPNAEYEALIHRIDQVLGRDGHLI